MNIEKKRERTKIRKKWKTKELNKEKREIKEN